MVFFLYGMVYSTDKVIITKSPVATYHITSLGHLGYCKQVIVNWDI
jgi:hypothetical protein